VATKKRYPRVIIEVRGGVVVAVYSSQDIHVAVMDWDDGEEDAECLAQCENLQAEAKHLKVAY